MKGVSQHDISCGQRILLRCGLGRGSECNPCECVRLSAGVCVGVPVRMFACLHVIECLKLLSADGK